MLLDDDEDAYSSENASDFKDKVEHASDDSTSPTKQKGKREIKISLRMTWVWTRMSVM